MTNHLTALLTAESATVAAIDAATANLNNIGTDSLTAALDRFRVAASAAVARLAAALPAMAEIADLTAESIKVGAAQIAAAFACPARREEPKEQHPPHGEANHTQTEDTPDDKSNAGTSTTAPQPSGQDDEQPAATNAEVAGAVLDILRHDHPKARSRQKGVTAVAANLPASRNGTKDNGSSEKPPKAKQHRKRARKTR